jgi:cytochrome c
MELLIRKHGSGAGHRCAARMLAAARTGTLAALLLVSGCELGRHDVPMRQVPGGDPDRGRQALVLYGCGACHVIPGVDRAAGRVAPPLSEFASRAFVAGVLPNRPDELVRWIQDPPAVNPQTAMPNLGVTEQDARHMAAYLYTLR